MNYLIALEGITFGYSTPLFSQLSLTIAPHEFWVLLGANGSGKTTLLRIILGLLTPWQGRITIPPSFSLREQSAFVPQKLEKPYLASTVEEFVLLGLEGLKLPRREKKGRLEEALERTGLATLRHRRITGLSGGEERRMLLARALVRKPLLLFLDEPTAGLDPASEADFLAQVAELHHQGVTIVLVTHEPEHTRFASHVALFAHGKVYALPTQGLDLTPPKLEEFYRKGDLQLLRQTGRSSPFSKKGEE